MNNPSLSKFYCRYLQEYGSCRFNQRCLFNHLAPPASFKIPDHVCLYFLKGKCHNSNCSFLHIDANELIEQLKILKQIDIQNGEPSTSSTSSVTTLASKYSNRYAHENHSRSNKTQFNERTKKTIVKEEKICSICLEEVNNLKGKRFGLLSNCDHCFCFECIIKWRKTTSLSQDTTRSCPTCRIPSNCVIPNHYFATGESKKRIIENFKNNRKEIVCKYEQNGVNNCRNQETCFFKHNFPFKQRPRRFIDRSELSELQFRLPNASLILNTIFLTDSDEEEEGVHISFAF